MQKFLLLAGPDLLSTGGWALLWPAQRSTAVDVPPRPVSPMISMGGARPPGGYLPVSELCDGLNAGFRAPATSDDILGIACSQAERVLRFRVEGGIDDAFLDQVIGGPKGVSKKLALANVVYKEDAKRIFVETTVWIVGMSVRCGT